MKYVLDTEFNEQGGELISIALIREDDEAFYAELPIEENAWKPWVKLHVKPLLTGPTLSKERIQTLLTAFFAKDENPCIYCDWPADIAHLCALLDLGNGYRLGANHWEFHIFGKLGAVSEKPHHALSDARAIKKVLQQRNIFL